MIFAPGKCGRITRSAIDTNVSLKLDLALQKKVAWPVSAVR